MPKTVLVFLADGFEEVEAVTPVDFLRRAGIEAVTVAVGNDKTVTGARGIPVVADKTLPEAAGLSYDAVVLPGGMPGSKNLAASDGVDAVVREATVKGRLIAAICAAPVVVLAPKGVLAGKQFTCFPGMEHEVSGATWREDKVVVDGNLITSRGAGTAALFALAIIEHVLSRDAAEKVGKATLVLD
ncbi:MAG: DJ-1/PfpI family protein [Spirochaetaceae bacterium]|jgi:4-methyl-5(b-hydroxyethyl)-thiazole monophosphate biosynthesis|nr:DJ-1/PfpI family protein [Spirochaetaceae bacterium]